MPKAIVIDMSNAHNLDGFKDWTEEDKALYQLIIDEDLEKTHRNQDQNEMPVGETDSPVERETAEERRLRYQKMDKIDAEISVIIFLVCAYTGLIIAVVPIKEAMKPFATIDE